MSSKNTSSGIGFMGMLGILFIALKLTENIDWSWWFVFLPLYWFIPAMAVIFVASAAGLLIKELIKN